MDSVHFLSEKIQAIIFLAMGCMLELPLTQSLDKKLDRAYTKMLRVVKNVTNEALYAGLPRISTTIRERHLRFSGQCWRSENEVVRDLVLWEPQHGKRNVRGQACTSVNLLEADNGAPETACQQ